MDYVDGSLQYTENNMLKMLSSHHDHGDESDIPRNRATYIDLDLLTTLETRITSIRELNACPVYYLGWTQQKSQPWQAGKQPNSFDLD